MRHLEPRSCLRSSDLRISTDAVAELLEASASAARIEDFALRLAQRRGLSNLGPLALIVREQPTVRKAIEVLIQYIGLHSDALCPSLDQKERVVTISRMLSGKRVRTDQALELAVAMFYRIIKHSSVTPGGRKKSALCTTLRHIPKSTGISLLRGAIQLELRWNSL